MNEVKVDWDFTDCLKCGTCGDFKVITESDEQDWFFDGDVVVCNECGHKGWVDSLGDGTIDVCWEDVEYET